MNRPLTRVSLYFVPDRLNVWLRFGRPVELQNLDRYRRVAMLAPDSLFGRVWWRGNRFGTTEWSFMVLRSGACHQSMLRLPGIEPGAEVLLSTSVPHKVQQVLRLVDDIEAAGIDPTQTSPHYWRLVNGRLAVNACVPSYCRDAHAAYLAVEACR